MIREGVLYVRVVWLWQDRVAVLLEKRFGEIQSSGALHSQPKLRCGCWGSGKNIMRAPRVPIVEWKIIFLELNAEEI